jgi:hypothetical protein
MTAHVFMNRKKLSIMKHVLVFDHLSPMNADSSAAAAAYRRASAGALGTSRAAIIAPFHRNPRDHLLESYLLEVALIGFT